MVEWYKARFPAERRSSFWHISSLYIMRLRFFVILVVPPARLFLLTSGGRWVGLPYVWKIFVCSKTVLFLALVMCGTFSDSLTTLKKLIIVFYADIFSAVSVRLICFATLKCYYFSPQPLCTPLFDSCAKGYLPMPTTRQKTRNRQMREYSKLTW